jgi:predicted N-acyltransferase
VISVRAQHSIADVPAAEWDSLVGADDLQASHRFVGVCERARVADASYRHVLVYDGDALAAVASLCVMRVRLDLLATGIARSMMRGIRRVIPRFLEVPVVFCGMPVSFGQSLLRIHHEADAAAALAAIDAVAEELAASEGAPIVCFKEHADGELATLAPLERGGYQRLPSLPSCRLPISWSSFDEYVGAMRAGYRRQLRETLRSRDRHGLCVRTSRNVEAECARIVPLYEQVMDHAEVQLERLPPAFFTELAREFPAETSALLVERDGDTLAAAVMLSSPRVATFLLAGLDYARHRALRSYPILVTAVVASAIERGAEALEMGQTSWALKQRLGAIPAARHLFARSRAPWLRTALRLAGGQLFPETRLSARRVFTRAPQSLIASTTASQATVGSR